jgi:prepilin-type processing-associated H-X9-DG protein
MDELLVGYLLKALEAEEQRAVEQKLRESPEVQKRLAQLQRKLDQLGRTAADPEPPEGLWVRTLARVAEHHCSTLPSAPAPSAAQKTGPGRTWWRRADVLVAAVLLIVVSGLSWPFIATLRESQKKVACQDNLRKFHAALWKYSEQNQGHFPWVRPSPPEDMAGYFVPILNDAGLFSADMTVTCAGVGQPHPAPPSIANLEALRISNSEEYRRAVRQLAGCYAYSLGYEDEHKGRKVYLGLTNSMDGLMPILADAPTCLSATEVAAGNSTNHGGKGQNVLFIDGHVAFCTTRTVGIGGDDIYVNLDRHVEAGRGPYDTVLGRSDASPYPPREEGP